MIKHFVKTYVGWFGIALIGFGMATFGIGHLLAFWEMKQPLPPVDFFSIGIGLFVYAAAMTASGR